MSASVPLQLETASTLVSSFQFLLSSQRADFELHFELLSNGVEHLADRLEDVHDVSWVILKFSLFFGEQISFLIFHRLFRSIT